MQFSLPWLLVYGRCSCILPNLHKFQRTIKIIYLVSKQQCICGNFLVQSSQGVQILSYRVVFLSASCHVSSKNFSFFRLDRKKHWYWEMKNFSDRVRRKSHTNQVLYDAHVLSSQQECFTLFKKMEDCTLQRYMISLCRWHLWVSCRLIVSVGSSAIIWDFYL